MCRLAQRLKPLAPLAAVLKTVHVNLETTLHERLELEKHVDNTAVVHRTRDVKTNDMYLIIRRISHISSAKPPLHSPNRGSGLQI